MSPPNSTSRSSGGRPPKFDEPSRPITVTLPERTLKDLEVIDADRAVAIVKATDNAVGGGFGSERLVELVTVSKEQSLIVVAPCQALRNIPWLSMVEIAPTRFLLALPSGTQIEVLEVAISDMLEHLPASEDRERRILGELRTLIASIRRNGRVTKAELLLVNSSGRS
jgi:hypothetical protein